MVTYAGLCIGGPYSGQTIVSYDRAYPLALMVTPPYTGAFPHQMAAEVRRGLYEFDATSSAWWWRGWGKGVDMLDVT